MYSAFWVVLIWSWKVRLIFDTHAGLHLVNAVRIYKGEIQAALTGCGPVDSCNPNQDVLGSMEWLIKPTHSDIIISFYMSSLLHNTAVMVRMVRSEQTSPELGILYAIFICSNIAVIQNTKVVQKMCCFASAHYHLQRKRARDRASISGLAFTWTDHYSQVSPKLQSCSGYTNTGTCTIKVDLTKCHHEPAQLLHRYCQLKDGT